MKLDSDDISGVAEQRLLELRQAELGIATAEAFVEHHLLRIVSPAFNVRTAIQDLANLGRKLLCIQKLNVVPGIGLMNRDDVHHGSIESPEMLVLMFWIPLL